ncbi:hypothetical protein [Falsarthrobacter nasiphocae]|uniref:Uncharacterized protein n=1 Tax=Falsarthrobacter nasiphocae TaxID=189863 RepID=A0AAE3YFE9_9MICC|nr:hypothetical protein [Falsarthrobacter nasiphocae]MDR6892260.1 hypothetical protein [Falsarthrobacter nasiphocae]
MSTLTRAALLAALATLFASAGHALASLAGGGGHGLSLGGFAVAWLMAVMVASVLTRFRRSAAGLAAILGLGQLGFHAIFILTAHGASHDDAHAAAASAAASAPAVLGGHAAHGYPAVPVPHAAGAGQSAFASFLEPAMLSLHGAAWLASVVVVLWALRAADRTAGAVRMAHSPAPAGFFGPGAALILFETFAAVRARLESRLRTVRLEAEASPRCARSSILSAPLGVRGPPVS